MNMDQQIEAERFALVAAVVHECQTAIPPVPLNHGIVRAILAQRHEGFDYLEDADDFHVHLSTMDTAPRADVTGKLATVETSDAVEGPQEVQPEPIDVPRLRARHQELDQKAANLRASLFKLQADRQTARAALADAISGWQNSTPHISDAQLRRDFLEASALEREQAKRNGAARVPAGGFGRSVIDRQAAYGHGGDANSFVQKQIRVGFRRRPPPLPSAR